MGVYLPGIDLPENGPKTITLYPDGTIESISRMRYKQKAVPLTPSLRTTKWEGNDPDGTPRAVLAKREGSWVKNMDEALFKLAKFEDAEEEENSWQE